MNTPLFPVIPRVPCSPGSPRLAPSVRGAGTTTTGLSASGAIGKHLPTPTDDSDSARGGGA